MHPLYESLLQSWSHDRGAWIASTAISLVAYAAVALAIPAALARIPADHFARPPRRHPLIVHVLRALVGAAIAGAGVALLFLPGPGILTILLGLSIIGGPLAGCIMRKLVRRPRVLEAINGIRQKRGREPLLPPDDCPHDSA